MNRFTPNYISPPINPGDRTWCGVKPEKHIVDYNYQSGPNANLAELMAFRSPPEGCDMVTGTCGFPAPYAPPVGGERVEGFGLADNTQELLLRLVVLAAVFYLVYYVLNQGKAPKLF